MQSPYPAKIKIADEIFFGTNTHDTPGHRHRLSRSRGSEARAVHAEPIWERGDWVEMDGRELGYTILTKVPTSY